MSKIQNQRRLTSKILNETSRILDKIMSAGMKCANCNKGVMYGHNMSHAKNRTNRIFEPNLHLARVVIEGMMKRVKLCVKCLRKLKKEMNGGKAAISKVESSTAATV